MPVEFIAEKVEQPPEALPLPKTRECWCLNNVLSRCYPCPNRDMQWHVQHKPWIYEGSPALNPEILKRVESLKRKYQRSGT